ncbi:MAG: antitoxin TumA, partial [Dolichospermum sp.]
MRKQTIQYTSPLDALVAVAKRLSIYENQQKMDSEEFFYQYNQGILSDDALFIEWA